MLTGCSYCRGFLHYPSRQPKQQGIYPLLCFAWWICQSLQDCWVLALTVCVITAAIDKVPRSNVGPIKGSQVRDHQRTKRKEPHWHLCTLSSGRGVVGWPQKHSSWLYKCQTVPAQSDEQLSVRGQDCAPVYGTGSQNVTPRSSQQRLWLCISSQ